MEHVLLIWASPNRDGLTSAAKNAVLRGLAAGGARADEVWLNHCAMQRCMACGDGWGLCRAEGRCVLKDDFWTGCAAARRPTATPCAACSACWWPARAAAALGLCPALPAWKKRWAT